jgi:[ribosomal protein S5]-alanine N-acetyltransferase
MAFSFQPFPRLASERLLLRRLDLKDDKEIMILRSDERILKYLLITPCTHIAEARLFIENINRVIDCNESIYWGITEKNADALIGTICIWHIDVENHRAEIGYVLHPDFQRKGLMSEALNVVLRYAFKEMKLHSLEPHVDPANKASIELLKKKGFVKEAHFKDNIFFNDKFMGTEVYSLINNF